MSPEHTFTLWTTVLTAIPTIAFTGVVAYWTWRRDQERIVVQKTPVYLLTPDGKQSDETLRGMGIVVTNLSLFPVRIVGLGFRMDEKHLLAFDHDAHKNEWLLEIASHARMIVLANEGEWADLQAHGVRNRIKDWKFAAIASTETGSRFSSNRPGVRVTRPLRTIGGWLKRLTGIAD